MLRICRPYAAVDSSLKQLSALSNACRCNHTLQFSCTDLNTCPCIRHLGVPKPDRPCLDAAVDVQKLATEREARLSMTEYELRVTMEDVVSLQVHVIGIRLTPLDSKCCAWRFSQTARMLDSFWW